jgi:hypothetical protein
MGPPPPHLFGVDASRQLYARHGVIFEEWYPSENLAVGWILDDGSYVEGIQASFSTGSDDAPDRELIIAGPVDGRHGPRTVAWNRPRPPHPQGLLTGGPEDA